MSPNSVETFRGSWFGELEPDFSYHGAATDQRRRPDVHDEMTRPMMMMDIGEYGRTLDIGECPEGEGLWLFTLYCLILPSY